MNTSNLLSVNLKVWRRLWMKNLVTTYGHIAKHAYRTVSFWINCSGSTHSIKEYNLTLNVCIQLYHKISKISKTENQTYTYHHKDPFTTSRELLKLPQCFITFCYFSKYSILHKIYVKFPYTPLCKMRLLLMISINYCNLHTWPSRWGASPRSIENEDAALFGSSYLLKRKEKGTKRVHQLKQQLPIEVQLQTTV